MSWQAYVDNNLVGTGNVTQAAIYGTNGAQWATSPGFQVTRVFSSTHLGRKEPLFLIRYCFLACSLVLPKFKKLWVASPTLMIFVQRVFTSTASSTLSFWPMNVLSMARRYSMRGGGRISDIIDH